MEILFFLILNIVSAQQDQPTKLASEDVAISEMESAEIVSVLPSGDKTILTFEVSAKGCTDRLSPLSYYIQEGAKNTVFVFVSGQNIHNDSFGLCFRDPRWKFQLEIPGSYSEDRVYLKTLTSEDEPVPLNSNDKSFSSVAEAQVVETLTANFCGSRSEFCSNVEETQIVVAVPLKGCMDKLTPLAQASYSYPRDRLRLFLGFQNIDSAKSKNFRCDRVALSRFRVIGSYRAQDIDIQVLKGSLTPVSGL